MLLKISLLSSSYLLANWYLSYNKTYALCENSCSFIDCFYIFEIFYLSVSFSTLFSFAKTSSDLARSSYSLRFYSTSLKVRIKFMFWYSSWEILAVESSLCSYLPACLCWYSDCSLNMRDWVSKSSNFNLSFSCFR